jgi:hypothetical protein
MMIVNPIRPRFFEILSYLLSAFNSIINIGLEFIWEKRKQRKATPLFLMRTELEAAASIRRRSKSKKRREAGDIMMNMLDSFVVLIVAITYK